MRKNSVIFICLITIGFSAHSQIDKDQLALEVSKIDAENTEKLKEYIWKFHADVLVDGGNKTLLISEFQYDDAGELNIRLVDGETNIVKKLGVRGKMQQNVIKSKVNYIANTMKYALTYTSMTKGQLLDFFDKAEVSENDDIITAKGNNIYIEGDELIINIDAESKLYLSKSFYTKMNADIISGEVQYDTFKSSGVNHITITKLDLPTESIKIEGENKDYTIKVE